MLAARKLTSDKKTSALSSQLTQLQDEKEQNEGHIRAKDSELSDAQSQLKQKENELVKLHQQQVGFENKLHPRLFLPPALFVD